MNNEPRYYDPKIVPPPDESEEITVELTEEQIRLIDEVKRKGLFWSTEEFLRWFIQELVKDWDARHRQ
jgi:Arc/MetJ-type ribon-helix-helix transcriptional regulator